MSLHTHKSPVAASHKTPRERRPSWTSSSRGTSLLPIGNNDGYENDHNDDNNYDDDDHENVENDDDHE